MVLTATKARKDEAGLIPNRPLASEDSLDQCGKQLSKRRKQFVCCTPDVYGVIISILMQASKHIQNYSGAHLEYHEFYSHVSHGHLHERRSPSDFDADFVNSINVSFPEMEYDSKTFI